MGIAHHLGWAVAVTASAGHEVVDRRRIGLIEPGVPAAPVEHEAGPLSDGAAARMVAEVRASALRATSASLDQLAASLPGPLISVSLRAWPLDFPDDIAAQRRPPYSSRADSVMYCQVLAECADAGRRVSAAGAAASPLARVIRRSWLNPGRRAPPWWNPGPRVRRARCARRGSAPRSARKADAPPRPARRSPGTCPRW